MERYQRQLNVAIHTQPDASKWREYLLIVIPGLPSTVKEDIKSISAELYCAYMENFHKVSKFFNIHNVFSFKQHICTDTCSVSTYLTRDVKSSEFVFVRRDAFNHRTLTMGT